jgi:hypothetical protein
VVAVVAAGAAGWVEAVGEPVEDSKPNSCCGLVERRRRGVETSERRADAGVGVAAGGRRVSVLEIAAVGGSGVRSRRGDDARSRGFGRFDSGSEASRTIRVGSGSTPVAMQ